MNIDKNRNYYTTDSTVAAKFVKNYNETYINIKQNTGGVRVMAENKILILDFGGQYNHCYR